MSEPTQIVDPNPSPTAPPVQVERRRPGRMENVSPALIPLLRRENMKAGVEPEPAEELGPDDLAAARGVAVSVLAGLSLWAALILALYWLF